MKKRYVGKAAFIVMFIVFVCFPWIGKAVWGQYTDQTNYENRELVEKPILTRDNLSDFPTEYEAFYMDNIPFRNEWISLDNKIKFYVFHTSESERVIIGKDGWLFYNDVEDGDPMSDYDGTSMFSEGDLRDIAANLCATQDYLEENGIEFVVFIAPNKERVYAEYMPNYVGAPATECALFQVVEYLRENTDLNVVSAYDDIMNTKQRLNGNEILYHKSDTHWNCLGAYVGARALMNSMDTELPSVFDEKVYIQEIENGTCDLANLISMGNELRTNEVDYQVQGYGNNDSINDVWNFPYEIRYHSNSEDQRKVFLVGDSFSMGMAGYLGEEYREIYVVKNRNFSNGSLFEENPDVFVLETVERYLWSLATFDVTKE